MWRGSIKISIHFNTSIFTTTRVRISHVYANDFTVDLSNYSGDVISKVVDVTGDTWVDFVVPYLDAAKFKTFEFFDDQSNTTSLPNLGTVAVSIVNPVTTPDTTGATVVFASIYMSAAEDFELAGYVGHRTKKDAGILHWAPYTKVAQIPVEEADAQTSLTEVFAKPFTGLTPTTLTAQRGMITQDDIVCVTDLMKRYYPRIITFSSPGEYAIPVLPDPAAVDVNGQGNNLAELCYPFLFHRGSTRVKGLNIITNTATQAFSARLVRSATTTLGPAEAAGTGAVYGGIPWNKPIIGAEIPYFAPYPFYETIPTTTLFSQPESLMCNGSSTANWMQSAGDDYSLGYLAAPPQWVANTEAMDESVPVKTPPKGKGKTK
jgi:hypothetical protein